MSIILWGQYPRSEKLVRASRDWDRNRINDTQLYKVQQRDREELLHLQQGFHYSSTGQIHWEDLIRPLVHLSPTLSSGALTRFFETNTFWRTLKGEGTIDQNAIFSWISEYFPLSVSVSSRTIYSFPFWFLFKKFSSGLSLDDFIPLLERLPKGLILFVEPSFGWKPISPEEKNKARQFLDSLKKRTESSLALITTFHNIKKDLSYLYDLPVDGIGIDFYHNTLDDTLPTFPKDKFLIAGIMDTDSTSLETPETIFSFKSQVEKYLPPKKIAFSHSGPAELLPRKVMDAKVHNLMEILA